MAAFGKESDTAGSRIQNHKGKWNAFEIYEKAFKGFKTIQNLLGRASRFVDIDINNMETVYCMAEIMAESNICEVSREGRKAIKRWLWKIYHQCPPAQTGKSALAEPYLELMKIYKKYELMPRLSILTTNYDLVLEFIAWKAGTKCGYPFTKKLAERCRLLEYDEPYVSLEQDLESPVVCKLHGSINYFNKAGAQTLLSVMDNVVPNNRALPRGKVMIGKSYIPGLPEIFAFDALSELIYREKPSEPEIIPPTYAKLKKRPWLREIWHTAFRAIQYARHIIFIGYSLPPTDGFMHAMIRSAMALREDANRLQIYVVDPKPSKEYERLFNKGLITFCRSTLSEVRRNGDLEEIFRGCL